MLKNVFPTRCEMENVRDNLARIAKENGYSPNYVAYLKQPFNVLMKDLGIMRLQDINDAAVNGFVAAMRKRRPDVTPRAHARYLSFFRLACNQCVKLGILRRMPKFPHIPHTSEFSDPIPTGTLSLQDSQRILDAASVDKSRKGKRKYCLAAMGLKTDLRRTEVLSALKEHVNLDRGLIRVPRRESIPYTALNSPCPIDRDLVAVLRDWIQMTPGSPYLFPGNRGITPWPAGGAHGAAAALRQLGESVGIKGLNFEMLRTFYMRNARPTVPEIELMVQAPAPRPAVRFIEDELTVLLRGKQWELTQTQWDAIRALFKAFPDGLTSKQMFDQTRAGGWRTTLRRLRKLHPDWNWAIQFPGSRYARGADQTYRMRADDHYCAISAHHGRDCRRATSMA